MSAIFSRAYEEYYPLIVRVAYRITGCVETSEDLAQEAFIRYHEHCSKIPPGEQAKYWMIRVVKNLAYNYEKRRRREQTAYQRHYFEPKIENVGNQGEVELVEREVRKGVQDMLLKLPYKFRVVLTLKEYANLEYRQIGEILNISEGNVKIRVFRARKQLKEIMEKEDKGVS